MLFFYLYNNEYLCANFYFIDVYKQDERNYENSSIA